MNDDDKVGQLFSYFLKGLRVNFLNRPFVFIHAIFKLEFCFLPYYNGSEWIKDQIKKD